MTRSCPTGSETGTSTSDDGTTGPGGSGTGGGTSTGGSTSSTTEPDAQTEGTTATPGSSSGDSDGAGPGTDAGTTGSTTSDGGASTTNGSTGDSTADGSTGLGTTGDGGSTTGTSGDAGSTSDGTMGDSSSGSSEGSASTGTDAAPYFRIFNPVSQSRKFDPDGEFLRRMLPELRYVNPLYNQYVYMTGGERLPIEGYAARMQVEREFRDQMARISMNENPYGPIALYTPDGIAAQNAFVDQLRAWRKNHQQLENDRELLLARKNIFLFDERDAMAALRERIQEEEPA